MTREYATPRLRIFECEGHGRYFEVYDGPTGVRDELGGYGGTFDTGAEVCAAYAGRIALLYTFDDYDRACLALMEADPEGWDTSDVVPDPHLVMVRAAPIGEV